MSPAAVPSHLARIPAAVALCQPAGDRAVLIDASDRFRALVGPGTELFETALRVDPAAFTAAVARAREGGGEELLEADLDARGTKRRQRLALRAAEEPEGALWLSLQPASTDAATTPTHFESIVQESPDIIAMIDRDFRHRFVNQAVEEASGLTTADFEGKSHAEMGMPEEMVTYFQSVYREVFATGKEGRKVFEFPAADGSVRSYESRVVPLIEPDGSIEILLSYARDTTERKASEAARLELERKIQDTQRLESLGLLAGGIAHDFNNLLTGILGVASLTRAQLGALHQAREAQESLAQIEDICLQAAGLCGQMLAYAGRGRTVTESLSLAEILRETRELLGASVSKDLSFELELGDELPAVEADRGQIQQVLMNLLLNAAEATSGSGTVSVALREVDGATVDWSSVVLAPEDTHATLVEVEVTDRGVGMDPTTVARIFDPFFTTKFTGRGLGLAATLGILRRHGSGLIVESTPGEGTTFRLYFLPQTRPSSEQVEGAVEAVDLPPCRVLLVDDEEAVRDAAGRMLRAMGHDVSVACEGVEALARYDAAQSGFDLVLLDLTMPGMDGIATLERFRERSPELPVVLMSGYTEEDVRSRLKDERTAFLSKPFRFERLQRALQAAVPLRRSA